MKIKLEKYSLERKIKISTIKKIFTRMEIEEFFEMLTGHLTNKGYAFNGVKLGTGSVTDIGFSYFVGNPYITERIIRNGIFDISGIIEFYVKAEYTPNILYPSFPPKNSFKVIDGVLEISAHPELRTITISDPYDFDPYLKWEKYSDMEVEEKFEVMKFIHELRNFISLYKKIKKHRLKGKTTKKI